MDMYCEKMRLERLISLAFNPVGGGVTLANSRLEGDFHASIYLKRHSERYLVCSHSERSEESLKLYPSPNKRRARDEVSNLKNGGNQ